MSSTLKKIPFEFPLQKFPAIQEEDKAAFQKLLREDYSPYTIKAIIFDLEHFLGWYLKKNHGVFALSHLMEEDISNYKIYCQKELQHAPATIQRKLLRLRMLCEIGMKLGTISGNPVIRTQIGY